MTKEEILAMVPGPELDAAVAINVMGWSDLWTDGKVYMAYPPCEQKYSVGEAERHPVWPFSTDIAAAMELLEHMRQTVEMDGCRACIEIHTTNFATPYLVTIGGIDVWGNTIPEAVAKAALLAKLGVE